MSVEGVSRSVLSEQVKDRLLQEILSGRYPPETRIVETRVARELGTSQAPVREALRALEAVGVIEIEPFRGARVRRPSSEQLLEAYVVRSDLEALAARLGVPRMTRVDLAEIEERAADMRRAADLDDRRAVAAADVAFHARIVAMSGNRVLERVWQNLEPFSRTYLTVLVPNADLGWTVGLHEPILVGLRERDPLRAVDALRRHFDEAGARLVRNWPESPDGAG